VNDVLAGKNLDTSEITLGPRDFKLLWIGGKN